MVNREIPVGQFSSYCCPLILKTLVNENDKASFVYFLLEAALSSSYSHYPCTLQSFISGQQKDGALHRRISQRHVCVCFLPLWVVGDKYAVICDISCCSMTLC